MKNKYSNTDEIFLESIIEDVNDDILLYDEDIGDSIDFLDGDQEIEDDEIEGLVDDGDLIDSILDLED